MRNPRKVSPEDLFKTHIIIITFSGKAGTSPACNIAFKKSINSPAICTNHLLVLYILFFSQGIINQNYICTPVQLSTGTCGEMSGELRAGGQPVRRSTISVACRPASVFSGNFFKTPSPWPMTPSGQYEVAAANAATTAACNNSNKKVNVRTPTH